MNYICGDLYDEPKGYTYICTLLRDHDGLFHSGCRMARIFDKALVWSDDAPRRRALRAVRNG